MLKVCVGKYLCVFNQCVIQNDRESLKSIVSRMINDIRRESAM